MDELSGYIISQVRLEQYAMLSGPYHKIETHIYLGRHDSSYRKRHDKPAASTVIRYAVDKMGATLVTGQFSRENIILVKFPANHPVLES